MDISVCRAFFYWIQISIKPKVAYIIIIRAALEASQYRTFICAIRSHENRNRVVEIDLCSRLEILK